MHVILLLSSWFPKLLPFFILSFLLPSFLFLCQIFLRISILTSTGYVYRFLAWQRRNELKFFRRTLQERNWFTLLLLLMYIFFNSSEIYVDRFLPLLHEEECMCEVILRMWCTISHWFHMITKSVLQTHINLLNRKL